MDTQTQVNSKEEWQVQVGKDFFYLDEKQIKVLKAKMETGDRGFIDFGDFGFAVSHVASFYLVSRRNPLQLVAGEKDYTLNEEQRAKARKKLEEIKKIHFGDKD